MTDRGIARSGFTLIECLVFITVSGVLLALATQLIHTAFSLSQSASAWQHQSLVLSRLSRDLRDDQRLAETAELISATQLRLQLPEQRTVVWQLLEDHVIRRTEGTADAVDNASIREDYHLPPSCRVQWHPVDTVVTADAATGRMRQRIRLSIAAVTETQPTVERLDRMIELILPPTASATSGQSGDDAPVDDTTSNPESDA